MAVATCNADEEREIEGFAGRLAALTRLSQPSHAGSSTEWPRLEIGNSSVTPWSRPITMAWKYVSTVRFPSGGRERAHITHDPSDVVRGQPVDFAQL